MQEKVQIISDGSLDLPEELTKEKISRSCPFMFLLTARFIKER